MNRNMPYSPRRRRWFLALLVPFLALTEYDFWRNLLTGLRPDHDWFLMALGAEPMPGMGLAGMLLTYVLPVHLLLAWMRQGVGWRSLYQGLDLLRYALMGLILCRGFCLMVFVLLYLLSKPFRFSWDDYPEPLMLVMMACSVAAGLFYYRLLLGMEIMTRFVTQGAGRGHGDGGR